MTPAATGLVVRPAQRVDAEAICRIYNEGIEDRVATLETRPREPQELAERLDAGQPTLVAELDGTVAGWAAILP
jgi:L-amino acid N-acyltransferase YncA